MSEATEELERRAIELYTDLNEVFKATPEGIDKEFLGKALAHLTTGALLLKATTDAFKARLRSSATPAVWAAGMTRWRTGSRKPFTVSM